jgi:hypothetical protein
MKKNPSEHPKRADPALEDVLSGIRSQYTLPSRDLIDLYIHVIDSDYSGKIYDIEILPAFQEPEWESAEGLESPPGWQVEKMGNGVRFYTETDPLLTCQGERLTFKIVRKAPLQDIRLCITDEDHENLGIVISTRK